MIGALINETRKSLLILWSYRVNVVMWSVFNVAIFIGVCLLFGDPKDVARLQSRPAVLLGFMVTGLANSAINTMAWGLREETQVGTLEQMAMSPRQVTWLLLGRLAAEMIIGVGQLVIVSIVVMLLMGFSVPLRLAGLPVLILTVVGLCGFGYMIGGLTLVYKRIDAVAGLVTNLLMWVNGTFVAVSYFPGWLEAVVRLLPSTQGIIVLRQVTLGERSLGAVWSDGDLIGLALHSLAALAVGVLIFRWCERVAKQRGSLGQY